MILYIFLIVQILSVAVWYDHMNQLSWNFDKLWEYELLELVHAFVSVEIGRVVFEMTPFWGNCCARKKWTWWKFAIWSPGLFCIRPIYHHQSSWNFRNLWEHTWIYALFASVKIGWVFREISWIWGICGALDDPWLHHLLLSTVFKW